MFAGSIPGAAAFSISMGGLKIGDAAAPRGSTIAATLPLGADVDPASLRLGIIAVLIGFVPRPMPAVALQDGDQVRLYVLDGAGFRLLAQRPAASGSMTYTLSDVLISSLAVPGNQTRGCSVVDAQP